MTGRKHSGSTLAGTTHGKGVAYAGPGNAALPARKPGQVRCPVCSKGLRPRVDGDTRLHYRPSGRECPGTGMRAA